MTNGVPIQTPRAVTELLIDQKQVVTVGGEGFGDNKHIRLSYAVSEKDIITAAERIRATVDQLD